MANKLRAEGIDAEIDQYEECPPEGWPLWMEKKIKNANYVLIACTETYLCRVEKREEKGKGLGVTWEASLIYQSLYEQQGVNTKFIPILFDENDKENIPTPLRSTTSYCLKNNKDYDKLYGRLIGQPIVKKPELGKRKPLSSKEVKTDPKTLFFTSVINLELWNKAEWGSTAYLCGGAPPVMLIGYKNIESGIDIFKEWNNYYKDHDKNDEIRISIIEGDIPKELPGYSVHINSNHEFKMKQFESHGGMNSPNDYMMLTLSRFNRMNPEGGKSQYLELFKSEYRKYGHYFIAPCAYDENTCTIIPYLEYKILKKQLIFKNSKSISNDDIDYVVIGNSAFEPKSQTS